VPALTTDQLHLTHSKYLNAVDADDPESFREALNEIMPRIYKMGYWREMLIEHTQDASDGYISLPHDTDSIVAGILDNNPLPTRSLWHDYKIIGTNDQDDTVLSAFIDDGYSPIYKDLDSSSQYRVKMASLKAPYGTSPSQGTVTIKYLPHYDSTSSTGSNSLVGGETALDDFSFQEATFEFNSSTAATGFNNYITNDANIKEIVSISWKGMEVDHPFRLIAQYQGTIGATPSGNSVDTTKDLLLANIDSTSGVSRYRRFRIGGTNSSSSAHLLLKRRWVNVDSGTDLVHIPSNAIIKHALLGKLAEDNADLQRAQYHWGTVGQLLESDTDSYRGAAKPTLRIAPNGVGANMSGMY
tara:strand:- start:79 stop:1146 length:1068 start_codon:yes stop_codon:yes gene_type:complete